MKNLKSLSSDSFAKRVFVFLLTVFFLTSSALPPAVSAQTRSRRIAGGSKNSNGKTFGKTALRRKTAADVNPNGETIGIPTAGAVGVARTTEEIMQAQKYAAPSQRPPLVPEREMPERENKPQDPNAKYAASYPFDFSETYRLKKRAAILPEASAAPQTVGTTFTGATLADTSAFPPDSMGAVGPSQFVVFVNGRIRTFNKSTGAADGVINADPDVFFASVLTPVPAAGVNFTSDPNVRYDRLTGRWIMTIIDVPSSTTSTIGDTPNRLLIAVSDAASSSALSGSTVWTFYFVQQNTVGGGDTLEFLDYPSLGIDANALYVGGNMFVASSGAFAGTTAFVIRKSSILSGGPVVATAFRGLITGGDGPDAPRGVDNYDSASNEGYFIGSSDAAFGRLILRRVSTPGGTPTISANILITVNATSYPRTVDHLGNLGGTSGRLDALDDRLFAAHIRNGRLWTAHNISVDTTGAGVSTGAQRRNAVRWYELNGIRSTDNGGTPVVVQSGTVFDNAATRAAAREYWIPTVMVSGQGHAALGYSTAGTPYRIDAATNGRLSGDTLGTLGAVNIYTAASAAYNPSSDPGGTSGRRWGDYSFVSLDPKDDMTMWTIQEFCSTTNIYGVRAAKLVAPPPASIANGPGTNGTYNVPSGRTSYNLTITGTSASGSGFYDPGANLAAPALPFNHISASVSGSNVVVNSVTYNSPTSVTLNLNTVGASRPQPGDAANAPASLRDLTITNPDGQSVTKVAAINILQPTAAAAAIGGRVLTQLGRGIGGARITIINTATLESRTVLTNPTGYFKVSDLPAGVTYVVSVFHKQYGFAQKNQSLDLNEDADLVFIGSAP